jgi:hypothetical protein
MIRSLTAALPLLAAGCLAGAVPADEGGRIVLGSWGGTHVGLELGPAGGTLDYDCASGTIEGPLRTDRRGRFSAAGFHVPGTGGPERVGHVPPRLSATYTGRVEGDRMTLRVRVVPTGVEIPLTLRRGAEPVIFRCL